MAVVDLVEVVLEGVDGHVEEVYLVLRVDSLLISFDHVEELLVGVSNSEILLVH